MTEACNAIIDLCKTLGQSMESVASDIFLNIIEKTASGVGVSILDGNIKLDYFKCCFRLLYKNGRVFIYGKSNFEFRSLSSTSQVYNNLLYLRLVIKFKLQ